MSLSLPDDYAALKDTFQGVIAGVSARFAHNENGFAQA